MWVTKQLLVLSNLKKNDLVTHIPQSIIFYVQQKKENIKVWNNLWVCKRRQNSFCVNYPFKSSMKHFTLSNWNASLQTARSSLVTGQTHG